MQRREFMVQALAAAFLAGCSGERATPSAGPSVQGDPNSTFHQIYGDEKLRARFKLFLVNVFHLFPEDELHALISRATAAHRSDADIYRAIVQGLPAITPAASMVRYALPALNKQKKVMVAQAKALVGEPNVVDGYLEIGTVGRYQKGLSKVLPIQGPTFVVNDRKPSKDIADIVERGQLAETGTFVELGAYDPLASAIPDNSCDLVTNYIGFHHCPDAALQAFIGGIRRVIRPGGLLVLREHDVDRPVMQTFVALAHDVFNAGTGVDWAGNQAELRHFRSVADWTTLLEGAGFKRRSGGQRQEGDPTDNVLMAFEKR